MLPSDLKKDKNGLLYLENINDLVNKIILLDQREDKDAYYASCFYHIDGTDDYIIKRPITVLNYKERKLYLEFLLKLIEKQKEIRNVDFPIGYYQEKRKLEGLIIPYYKDGVSLEVINKKQDINLINNYYFYDDDNVHNLFLLFEEIISLLNEMFEHGVYYTDTNRGNFIINNNKVKVIDFDPYYVKFDDKDTNLAIIIDRYFKLVNLVLENYHLPNNYRDSVLNFNEAKIFTKKIENNIRRDIKRW